MPGVIRRICDPPLSDGSDVPLLDVQSVRQFKISSSDVLGKYISPSFVSVLKEMIPLNDNALGYGGSWFWSCYFHALYGEDVLLDLSGTGVSLSEDSLDSQISLRQRLASTTDTGHLGVAIEHCCSKIETLCAVALSLVLHVSHQPMLEDNQGPQALVLCATKEQCDEVYALVDRFGAALHLVTHNLFGAYPPMPAGRRADIVIGTLPLWESVAQVEPLASHDGLEEILYQVSDDARWTASSTRWRPYSLDFVAQLVLIDLDLQHALGYWPMVRRLFAEHKRSSLNPLKHMTGMNKNGNKTNTISVSGLPEGFQMYCLVGECRKGAELFTKLRALYERRGNGKNNGDVSRIALRLEHLQQDKVNGENVNNHSRKRRRNDDDDDDDDDHTDVATATTCNDHSSTQYPRLVIHNALSHSRLLLDASAFEDFATETRRLAQSFWSRFEATSCSATDEVCVEAVVSVQLAYGCRPMTRDITGENKPWCINETVAVITPINAGARHPSRAGLLIRHLEDELSGQIFDGSVVQCLSHSHELACVDQSLVTLQGVFAATANSLMQKPIFVLLDNVERDMAEALTHRAHLRQLVTEVSSKNNEKINFPLHKFLSNVPQQPWRTVLAFRNIAPNISVFCDSANGAKPTALLYLEECCQYGKVVSYFVYEQRHYGKDGENCVHFFVEFATREGAKEAVRQFSLRFASESQNKEGSTRVKLFSNELYYEGAESELRRRQSINNGAGNDTMGDRGTEVKNNSNDDDIDEDDFIDVSLLAE
ncbi:uncharacterized protein TM35_000361200 [Trypanosoma theileri]|uniref:Uncharacterized protein n=1 Tax=Trypanosoma theileri TaxID=67003 RepID=A0A1X0NMA5_9TRYP|nr:uncharacterized protein TM35_000361200 [Trypanosoma theileri]ORC85260.1 hypothetical protein TM35_000361200 [Trypanosoma theileri]